MHREGGVPDGGAVPRHLRGEDVEAQRPDERVDVRDADPSAPRDAKGAEQPSHLLLVSALAAYPLRYEREDLGLGGYRQVVLRQYHLHELDRQLRPSSVVGDGAEVPPLAERAHQLVSQLLLVGRVQGREVVEVEEHVRIEVVLDVLQAEVYYLINAVLVRQGEEPSDVLARDVDVARVDKPDQRDELVPGLRDDHLARDGLPQRHLHAQHLVEVWVLHENQGVAT
mmetsp:Transcript_114099/g.318722  ORF Transcript_114099/g.318722 Transcript_114099/m.318722 type:complete len:226 (+) Transcript_114099:233-910(+)